LVVRDDCVLRDPALDEQLVHRVSLRAIAAAAHDPAYAAACVELGGPVNAGDELRASAGGPYRSPEDDGKIGAVERARAASTHDPDRCDCSGA
jgi:hypothetical protein